MSPPKLMSSSTASGPLLRVHLVRHGETAENRSGVIQGQLDTALNDEGLAQAALVAEALVNVPFSVAFSSDLSRARSTAEKILESHSGVELQQSELLRERLMGSFQGRKATKGMMSAIAADPTAETREQFAHRAAQWWNETILPLAAAGPSQLTTRSTAPIDILVVSHGGLITTLLHELLRSGKAISSRYSLPLSRCFNTAAAVLEIHGPEGPVLLQKYGDIAHLLKPSVKSVVQDNADEV